ncbi:hypothetical protein QKW60_08305 [Defluviimonas aestuarii]|uniref:hypothetical protein n=1 Tax=Albidovulum aestuarii TaxID=1130726 RepID=UPI002499B830|nr:hypothetical protein [Defluviimonas aestuarii]MDI3336404.1 hypothetical protein [Defluviimonas aestuarii]
MSDHSREILDRVDALQTDLERRQLPDVSAEIATFLADKKMTDYRPEAATCNTEDRNEMRRREREISADFATFVAEPAKVKFPVCEVSEEVRSALANDLARGKEQFPWTRSEKPWRALCDLIEVRVGLLPDMIDEMFPDTVERFDSGYGEPLSIAPRKEFGRRMFSLVVRFIVDGRFLAFGERHGKVVNLNASHFEIDQFRFPGRSGSSWIDRIEVFSPLRFIAAKDAAEQIIDRSSSMLGTVGQETRAMNAIRQMAAAHPGVKMRLDDAMAALEACGFGFRARDRIWTGAAPEAWKASGTAKWKRCLQSNDLVTALKACL